MPDFDDYHAFESTGTNKSSDIGCSSGCLNRIIAILVVIYIICRFMG